jgi:maltodextrin utilization protein YvdJ
MTVLIVWSALRFLPVLLVVWVTLLWQNMVVIMVALLLLLVMSMAWIFTDSTS